MRKLIFASLSVLLTLSVLAQNTRRWNLTPDAGIRWEVKKGEAHSDNIEMAGTQMAAIVNYGANDKGELYLAKWLYFPMLRIVPNNTYGSLKAEYTDQAKLGIAVNGTALIEYPQWFGIKGKLDVACTTNTAIETRHTLFPSTDKAALIETISLKNTGLSECKISVANNYGSYQTDPVTSVYGPYVVSGTLVTGLKQEPQLAITLAPGENYDFAMVYAARKKSEEPYSWAPAHELAKRDAFVENTFGNLVLETPNDTIDRAFAFAKVRATESIYDTLLLGICVKAR